ncbi:MULTISPECIES: DUF2634 domain-containing protein [unclassified Clostridium]|uniref:DUF2634 domain-containing protein n=1 Tax=unclassified Clostridium TaxID=2614128 RepID=UPI000297297F|nr:MULTISPECIES: DUF2634 domain-containing protein [unclassified Clostridium]EKQ51390.1 MAG: Protein of unknown function (DUF2634) [Clostridium sp. Maddingley MBC34-26]
MFPSQETISDITKLNNANSINSKGKSPAFDFETGDFIVKDGKVETLTGYAALKQWIQKTLKTEQNKYKIYNTDNVDKYGAALLEIITSNHPIVYIQAQVQTIVTEALLKNSDIKAVNNFKFIRDKSLLNCEFDVISIYGTNTESVVR